MNLNRARFYLILIICLALIISTVRSIGDLYRGGDRVLEAKNQLSQLRLEHEKLVRENAMVKSDQYIEKIARDKLGMSKPGETVVVLPEDLQQEPQDKFLVSEPNWKKWQDLIF